MAKVSKIQMILAKRVTVEAEINRYREAIAVLEEQIKEFEIAERVLQSLESNESAVPRSPAHPVVGEGTQKPDGIPTMPEMILDALRESKPRGLEPRDMVLFIEKKYWPNVPSNAVGPIAWRMHDRGELRKRESKYFLPKDDEEQGAG